MPPFGFSFGAATPLLSNRGSVEAGPPPVVNIIQNGGFDADIYWTKQNLDDDGSAGVAITGGKLVFTLEDTSKRVLYNGPELPFPIGNYRITLDIDSIDTPVSAGSNTFTTAGAKQVRFLTISVPGTFSIRCSGNAVIDNVILEKLP